MLDFLAYLEFERGLSRNTLEAYRSDLLQFGAHLEKTGRRRADASGTPTSPPSSPSWPPATATARRWPTPRCSARSPACAPSTATCAARTLLADDPTAHLRAPRQSRKLPQVLTRDEVARLLEQPERHRAAGAARPRAAGGHVRLRAARLGGDGPRGRRRRPRGRASCAPAARAPRSASSRSAPTAGRALAVYLQRGRPRLAGDRLRAAPVPQPPRRRADPPGALQDRPAPRALGRAGLEDEPAHAAPHVRHPPARRRLRPALACRRCSATPTSPPPSSTPTSRPTASRTSYFDAHPRARRADAARPP